MFNLMRKLTIAAFACAALVQAAAHKLEELPSDGGVGTHAPDADVHRHRVRVGGWRAAERRA